MKTEWDYSGLAAAYLKRPSYAESVIDDIIRISEIGSSDRICDIGAGAAHLTLMFAERGFAIDAVEPNDEMRRYGIKRTEGMKNVKWHEAVGEDTGQDSDTYKLVSFGSSFAVTDRGQALVESYRILKSGGWFTCLWNHRDLDDPLQQEIEKIIKRYIVDYDYGTRRKDQTEIIAKSGLFYNIQTISGGVIHKISVNDFIEGWKSHGTVYRQAGNNFDAIISDISHVVKKNNEEYVFVPYHTNGWIAQATAKVYE